MINPEVISIDDLSPNPANTRTHPERNRATILASLKRFRAGRSLVCDGNNVVRAGNGTLAELAEAGIDEAVIVDPAPNQVVVVRRKDWSPSEATAYGIADNRATDQSTDDDAALAETLRSLQSEGFDLTAVGYDEAEVDALIAGLADEVLAAGELNEDETESIDAEPANTAKPTGQLYPLSVVLSKRQSVAWESRKASFGVKDDTRAFLLLAGLGD